MKTCKTIQLMLVGALALGLNGVGEARSFELNTMHADSDLQSIFRDLTFSELVGGSTSHFKNDTPETGGVVSITSGPGSLFVTNIAVVNYQFVGDLPDSMHKPLTGNSRGHADDATSHNVSAVPEPNVFALMLAGVGVIGFMSYRRQRSSFPGPVLFII